METSNRSQYKSQKQREFRDFYRSMFGQYEDDCELYSDDSEGDISLNDDSEYDSDGEEGYIGEYSSSTVNRVVLGGCNSLPLENAAFLPYLGLYYKEKEVQTLLRSGSKINIVSASCARRMNFPIFPVSKETNSTLTNIQLDPDVAVGEVHVLLTKAGLEAFKLDAIIVDNHDQDITAGMPFLKSNKVVIDTVNDEIVVNGSTVSNYGFEEHYRMP